MCLEQIEKENTLVFQFDANTSFQVNPMRSMELNPSPHILPMKLMHINNISNLNYDTSNKLDLSQFLKGKIEKEDCLKIILQISQVILDSDNYYANENNFVIDENYIYVNAQTFSPALMYFPVDFEGDVKSVYQEFLKRFLREERFFEDSERREFERILTKPSFRIQDAYQLIYSLLHGDNKKTKGDVSSIDKNPSNNLEEISKDFHLESSTSKFSNFHEISGERKLEGEVDHQSQFKGPRIPKVRPGNKGVKLGNNRHDNIRIKKDKKEKQDDRKEEKKKRDVDWGNILTNFFKEKLKNKKAADGSLKKDGEIPQKDKSFTSKEIVENKKEIMVETKKTVLEQKETMVKKKEKDISPKLTHPVFKGNLEATQLLRPEPEIIAWLIKEGESGRQKIEIKGKGYKIGRDPQENDLVLDDLKVSKKHASITCKDGEFFITDTGSLGEGSTNGVYLNGERIEKVMDTKIQNKDQIRIAKTTLIFQIEE
jgi:hypothetical protein